MTMHEKAIEAAHTVYERFGQSGDLKAARTSNDRLTAIIQAYNDALLPEDVAGLVERLRVNAESWRRDDALVARDESEGALADEAASLLQSQAARIAELEEGLERIANNHVSFSSAAAQVARAVLNGERKG